MFTTTQIELNQLYKFGVGEIIVRSGTKYSADPDETDQCVLVSMIIYLFDSFKRTLNNFSHSWGNFRAHSSTASVAVTSFSNLWSLCREVLDAHEVTNSADNLVMGDAQTRNTSVRLYLYMCQRIKRSIYADQKNKIITLTSRAFVRSSLVCEAEMQKRALARRRGVTGNATVITATCSTKISVNCKTNTIRMKRMVQILMDISTVLKGKKNNIESIALSWIFRVFRRQTLALTFCLKHSLENAGILAGL